MIPSGPSLTPRPAGALEQESNQITTTSPLHLRHTIFFSTRISIIVLNSARNQQRGWMQKEAQMFNTTNNTIDDYYTGRGE